MSTNSCIAIVFSHYDLIAFIGVKKDIKGSLTSIYASFKYCNVVLKNVYDYIHVPDIKCHCGIFIQ